MGLSFNKIIIAGNLAKEIELRYTQSGKAVTSLVVAVDGYSGENTTYYRVTVWDKQAEACQKYLNKGDGVLIEGRGQNETYEKNGVKHTSFKVVAQNVQFIPKRDGGSGNSGGGGNVSQQANTEGEFYEDDKDIPF